MNRNFIKLSFLVLVTGFSSLSCKDEKRLENIETDPITFEKEAELYLIRNSGDTIQKLDIELAETTYEHETGLMYREGMKNSQGMLFLYDGEAVRNFYMKNTYFPLDIIYFSADSSLVSIQKNTSPRSESTLPSSGPAKFVLEVNAGLSEKWKLESGDKLSLKKTTENEE